MIVCHFCKTKLGGNRSKSWTTRHIQHKTFRCQALWYTAHIRGFHFLETNNWKSPSVMVISVDGSNFQPLSQLESATVPLLPMWIFTVSSFLAKAPGTSADHHKLVEALVWLCMSTSAERENRANKIYHDLFELPDSINLWLFYANINFNHLSKEKYNMEMCICVSTHHLPLPL